MLKNGLGLGAPDVGVTAEVTSIHIVAVIHLATGETNLLLAIVIIWGLELSYTSCNSGTRSDQDKKKRVFCSVAPKYDK